jgi:glycerol-3-phosphate dehydrogenase
VAAPGDDRGPGAILPAVNTFDLVVVGGGITGLGIARLAARNGYTVAVIERGDLAGGASSASSHMLHGGLRYLEHGHYRLVRESLRERAAVGRLAPDLAHPARFLLPFYRGDRRPPWMVRTGLFLYDTLAGRSNLAPHAAVPARAAMALEPDLAPAGLTGAGLYSDMVMDDVRLAVAVARDALASGATIHTWTDVCGAAPAGDQQVEVRARDALGGGERRLIARTVVNAAGPWADEVRRRLVCSFTPGAADPALLMRPSRGTHLIFPALTRGHGLLLTARTDGRVFFVVPFAGMSLVGTTEVEVPSPPGPRDLRPDVEEIRYLRSELARVLPQPSQAPVLAVTSGVRPLLAANGAVGEAPRDGRSGRPIEDPLAPLPRPLGPDHAVERLAEFAVRSECARRVEDVVRRRTRLWLTPDHGRVAAAEVATVLARRLGWDEARRRDELRRYHDALADEERLVRQAWEEA